LFAALTGDFISVYSKGVRESRKWEGKNGKWGEKEVESSKLKVER